jgi:uncharacterized protein YrrD
MEDLGAPTSYLACTAGTPVIDTTGVQVGSVKHVLADEELDVFDGIVATRHHDPLEHRFADADQVTAIYERGVLLNVAWDQLHTPSENPAAIEVGADDLAGDETGHALRERLRRAWDLISGNG